jgi:hypothetical protein
MTYMNTSRNTSLDDARDWVRDNVRTSQEDVICPCCNTHASRAAYERRISETPIMRLVDLYRHTIENGEGFYHVSEFVTDHTVGRDFSMLRFIDFIERAEVTETSRSQTTSGEYRITELGRRFVEGNAHCPTALFIFRDELLEALGPDRHITGIWRNFRGP